VRQVSNEIAKVGLLALAGFLLGGVYSAWKAGNKILAGILIAAALLAAGGAVAWFLS
jgi:cbb3-type cytochrome oxidase subunit 3